MSIKIPMTPAGMETMTFRLVAQRLNHCATAVPLAPSNASNFYVSYLVTYVWQH